ncbi:MAG: 4Fe-4S ferredoxin, partial [Crenarchaeota archaeon]|nr:4Fe-4S ferredoxin [Thermoproteota archaeon]
MTEVYIVKAQRPRYDRSESLVIKLPELLEKAGISGMVSKNSIVAIKLHLGVMGGYRTIRPQFI